MMYNSRKPKVLFRPARWLLSSFRYGFLMPIACGRRMFAAQKEEDFSSHIQWVNSKIKDPNYHIESLTDLSNGTSLLQLVDSCLKSSNRSRHEFVFGEMDDTKSLTLVKVRVALNLMQSRGIIRTGEFSAELIAAGDIEHIRAIVVKLALFPTTLQRGQSSHAAENENNNGKMNVIPQLFIVSLAFSTIPAQNYILSVVEDVTLERGSTNFNYLSYLIVGTHPGFPLKRSLMKFQNIPTECVLPLQATLHIYFVYAHKASYIPSLPQVTRYITAHTVLKSWSESEATSTKRNSRLNWSKQWLDLTGNDASPLALYSTAVTEQPGGKWYTLDVTQQAQDWKFSSKNYGLLLRDTHEFVEGRDFRFASNAYGDTSKRAYITLNCQIQQRNIGGGISPIGGGENPI